MHITRKIHDIEIKIQLTQEEIQQAHTEHITQFMKNELYDSFGFDEKTATELAKLAYEKYAEGNGLTEYECIECIAEQYTP